MVKPLAFKGDKKIKKRKHRADEETSTALTTTTDHDTTAQDSDEAWIHPSSPSDLIGPTLLLLPTKPATCLASDANGNIFASRLENIQDDVQSTAEPHDVRQVWVATKIAGLKEGIVSFKGSHGAYLSCDNFGVLRAQREAIGREEGFEIMPVVGQTGSFVLKTAASKMDEKEKEKGERYLAAVATVSKDDDGEGTRISVSLRGDSEDREGESTRVYLRMQARFKPQIIKEQAKEKDAKVSRRELIAAVGRELQDDEVRRLKRARKNGTYHEELLDVRVKGKHDKFAS